MKTLKPLTFDYLNNERNIPPLQDIHITENTQIPSTQDGDMVITRCGNLTVDEGISYSLSNRCAGWTIIANGTVTVNGTMSMSEKGMAIDDTPLKVEAYYGADNRNIRMKSFQAGNKHFGTLKEFTVDAYGSQGAGGMLIIYCKTLIIGDSGTIESMGAAGQDGGRIHIYYTEEFENDGSIEYDGGIGGSAGTATIEDVSYKLTEYQKTLGTGEYIYTMIDLGKGKAMLGTRDTGKVFYTEDYGENWTDQGTLQSAATVRCFVDFGNGKIWTGTGENDTGQAKLYETLNWGETWTLKYTFPTNNKRIASLCKITDNTVLAGTRNSTDKGLVYKTIDGGANWTAIGNLDTSDNVRTLILLSNGTVLAGTKAGKIYASINNGDTWALKSTVTTKKVRAFIELSGGIVLAGTWDAKIFRNENYGDGSWTQVQAWGTKQEISEFYNIIGNKILASTSPRKESGTDTQKHLAISDDGGENWRRIEEFSSSQTNSYLIQEQNILYRNILKHFINNPINHFGAT